MIPDYQTPMRPVLKCAALERSALAMLLKSSFQAANRHVFLIGFIGQKAT